MERYLIYNTCGNLKIVYGNFFLACLLRKKNTPIKLIPPHVSDDDIIYGRVKFEKLKNYTP